MDPSLKVVPAVGCNAFWGNTSSKIIAISRLNSNEFSNDLQLAVNTALQSQNYYFYVFIIPDIWISVNYSTFSIVLKSP